MDKCDYCDRVLSEDEDVMEVRRPRPSDPHDMCCVLSGCKDCFPYSKNTCMTGAQWEQYIESDEAVENGHIWLS